MRNIKIIIWSFLFNLSTTLAQEVFVPRLDNSTLTAYNRSFTLEKDEKQQNFVQVHGKDDAGVVWIDAPAFANGDIEFDVRGADLFQQSFVGIAWHGGSDSCYEAIYFRPFNFNSTDALRKRHAVQYIAMPAHDWFTLREKFPDRYEAALGQEINPNDWFHVKLVVDEEWMHVYVNNERRPVLRVQSLLQNKGNKIGLWTGDKADGAFRNLRIKENR